MKRKKKKKVMAGIKHWKNLLKVISISVPGGFQDPSGLEPTQSGVQFNVQLLQAADCTR